MIGVAGEKILLRRAHPQPQPYIHQSGDCGACSFGGALEIAVKDVYQRFDTTGITNRHEMERCLRCSISYGLADRMLDVPAEWPATRYLHSFGSPAIHEYVAWFNYVRLAIDADYYGLAQVDFSGNGGPDTNHWVLICGARTEGPVSGKILTGEILVSCSVKGEQWYESREFLRKMGGYDVLLIRPQV